MSSADEGVREIQLNGKQLVFLFMAVTVVSVVIFLCGVLVGRGVQARTTLVDAPGLAADSDAADDLPVASTPGAAEGPTTPPPLTFPDSLVSKNPTAEKLAPKKDPPPVAATTPAKASPPPAATPAPAPNAPAPTVAAVPPAPARAASAAPTPGIASEPRGTGFAIQVAALRGRDEAEVIVKRLAGKGYAAYLMSPLAGQPSVFRVRVGKFRERTEAEAVATRLEREEQFKPWITR